MTNHDDLVESMMQSIIQYKPLPPMPAKLNLQQAYDIQHQLTDKINGPKKAGIKAGITAKSGQQFFGLSQGVLGSLYSHGKLASGCEISAKPGLLLECEIGIILDAEHCPRAVMPIIEVVYMDFDRKEDANAANIIAANVGADRYICGEVNSWDSSYDDVQISMQLNQQTVLQTAVKESLGGPIKGTRWMIDEARDRGFKVTEGMLLILGTCGNAVPATPGNYTADYGDLGTVEFSIA